MKRLLCIAMSVLLLTMTMPVDVLANVISGNSLEGTEGQGIKNEEFVTDVIVDEKVISDDIEKENIKQENVLKDEELRPEWATSTYDFEVDNLYYQIIKEATEMEDGEVSVVGSSAEEGELILVGEVEYEGKRYCVTEIGDKAFYSCKGFTGDLIIPNGVTYIGARAFYNCDGFTGELKIPNSVTYIGARAFYSCKGFTGDLIIPNGVTKIEKMTFYYCSGFTGNLKISNSVTEIGEYAFYCCNGFTGDLIIPDGVTYIGARAFYCCDGFTGSLNIPNSVIEIGELAFYQCNKLTGKLNIPKNITKIGYSAFVGCCRFEGIVKIPESVKEIGYYVFSNCTGIEKFCFEGDKPTIPSNSNIFENITATIYYPSDWGEAPIDDFGGETWIPYTRGTNPWEMNLSSDVPAIWFTIENDPKEIVYDATNGYNINSFNLNIGALYMNYEQEQPVYENAVLDITLPDGLSFSSTEVSQNYTKELGNMDSETVRRVDVTVPVYLSGDSVYSEFEIDMKISADGYEKSQEKTYVIPIEIIIETAEETIIDVVEKYASGDEITELVEIMNSGLTDEEKSQKIYEFFNYDNMLDCREGITKLRDGFDEANHYRGLTNDELYTSYQWYHYLNKTPEGIGARVSLYASGLTFNGELGAWLDPSTYLDADLPGVKKYKTLLEKFIEEQNAEIEYYAYLKETEKFINGSVNLLSKVEKGQALKELGEAKSTVAVESVFNKYVESKLETLDGNEITVVYDEKTPLMESLGITHTVFKLTNVTIESIEDFVSVSSNLETYETYKSFLEEIVVSQDIPWEMRVAAYKLNIELRDGYWGPVEIILKEIRDECLDKALDIAGMSKVLGLNGYGLAISITSFVMNQFVDIGALVKNSAYTEGYAILAMHYRDKLETCKKTFLSNKTEQNAWAFYEAYTMLWRLRVQGEKMYLQMNKLEQNELLKNMGCKLVDVINDASRYADKDAAVNKILATLESYKFQYDISNEDLPEEYKYLQKIVVECPVDVEIATQDDLAVCTLKDKIEEVIENEHGKFVSFYRATIGDYVKVAYLHDDKPYRIKAIGQESGDVTYTIAKTEDNRTCTESGFEKVSIAKDSVIEVATNEDTYTVDEDGDGAIDITADQADKSKVYVQFDYQNGSRIEVVYVDSYGYITMPEEPKRDGYVFDGWYTAVNGKGSLFEGGGVITQCQTYYAYWIKKEKLSAPTASIASGSAVEEGTKIELACEQAIADIYYTLNGEDPEEEGDLYRYGIWIEEDTTIRAIAVCDGYYASDISEFSYIVKHGDNDNKDYNNSDNKNCDENDNLVDKYEEDDVQEDILVSNIELSGLSKSIAAGKSIKLAASVYPTNATNKRVNWKSSNKKYATVSSTGKVSVKKAGAGKTVTITATAKDGSGVKATYKIKIMKHKVKSIKLKASNKTVKAGKTVKIKATIKTTGKKVNKKLKWSTSNKKYATVTSKGVVKTKKAGKGKTVTITAASTDGTNKKSKIKIKIK